LHSAIGVIEWPKEVAVATNKTPFKIELTGDGSEVLIARRRPGPAELALTLVAVVVGCGGSGPRSDGGAGVDVPAERAGEGGGAGNDAASSPDRVAPDAFDVSSALDVRMDAVTDAFDVSSALDVRMDAVMSLEGPRADAGGADGQGADAPSPDPGDGPGADLRDVPAADRADGRVVDAPIAPPSPVVLATLGQIHACAALVSGGLKCWGWNGEGELGLGSKANRGDNPGELGDRLPFVDLGTTLAVRALSAGQDHTCVAFASGAVKCWGSGIGGRLGVGDRVTRGDDVGEMGAALPFVDLGAGRTASAVSVGVYHNCALLDGGAVKCWGSNFLGQMGLGDLANRGDGPGQMGDALPAISLGAGRTATQIAVGRFHSCALLDDHTVKCWGYNHNGQLGLGDTATRGDAPGEMGDSLPAVALGTGRTALALTAGGDQTCALLDGGDVKCWGANENGELGVGDKNHRGDGPGEMGDALPRVNLGTGRHAKQVIAGEAHTCALLDDDTVKCWGLNVFGQLGFGDVLSRGAGPGQMGDALPTVRLGTGRIARVLVAGAADTCAILDNGGLKCWGGGNEGQLGFGDVFSRGGNPDETGDGLAYTPLTGPSP
jgi:alpha-tubulin suppressor-like RCC1 family protein